MSASNGPALFDHPADGAARPRPPLARDGVAPFAGPVKGRLDWDDASAVGRMLADAAAVLECDAADLVLAPLRTAVSQAFSTGADRSWRELYVAVAGIVESSPHMDGPAYGRLCAFLEENADLAERPRFA